MARSVPFSKARSGLTKLLDEVTSKHEHVLITRNGSPAVVMISQDDYEALQETVEVLQDSELLAALHQSENDVRAGRVSGWRQVKRKLRRA